jgi:hypothetical protein
VDKDVKKGHRLLQTAGRQVGEEWHIIARWNLSELGAQVFTMGNGCGDERATQVSREAGIGHASTVQLDLICF